VSWGLAHRSLEGIAAIAVDEGQWRKGHRYLTLVYQIDGSCRRLLHIAPERTVRSLMSFFRMLGGTRSAALKFVCSDMWQPYLKVIAKKASQAVHVLDRIHIMAKMNKTLRTTADGISGYSTAKAIMASRITNASSIPAGS
jgi:transposase